VVLSSAAHTPRGGRRLCMITTAAGSTPLRSAAASRPLRPQATRSPSLPVLVRGSHVRATQHACWLGLASDVGKRR
jgi:hypothetical protein